MREMKKINGLKKIEAGAYSYKGRYYIFCGGYDRITGHIRWYGRTDDEKMKAVAEADTLSEITRLIDIWEKYEAKRGAEK